jgi:hypothetical protein
MRIGEKVKAHKWNHFVVVVVVVVVTITIAK